MARVIRFKAKCSPYNSGERAGFPDGKAAMYVAQGLAEYVTTDVPAAPVTKAVLVPQADEGPPPVEAEASAADEDTKPKRTILGRRKSAKKAKKKAAAKKPAD